MHPHCDFLKISLRSTAYLPQMQMISQKIQYLPLTLKFQLCPIQNPRDCQLDEPRRQAQKVACLKAIFSHYSGTDRFWSQTGVGLNQESNVCESLDKLLNTSAQLFPHCHSLSNNGVYLIAFLEALNEKMQVSHFKS